MREFYGILGRTRLFSGVDEAEIASILGCLDARLVRYPKGAYIARQGEDFGKIAILVAGCLHIRQDDYWGNSSIVGAVRSGEMFGEAYATKESGAMASDVVAIEESAVIFLELHKILSVCSSACSHHTRIVQNLFLAISEKNRRLVEKVGLLSRRTTREKLLEYLSGEARRQGSGSFLIPFNRQQLADYLSVDRSAMSNELSKLRDEGILTFHKNEFCLKTLK